MIAVHFAVPLIGHMKYSPLSWIELDSAAFRKNIASLSALAGHRKMAAAVKANAYGHGLREILVLLKSENVEYIAVHSLQEAQKAREYGWDRQILIVGYISLADLGAVFDLNVEPTVYNIETIKKLGRLAEKANRTVKVHLKLETGTNRQGVEEFNLEKVIEWIGKYEHIKLKGISTHFANIEDTTDHSYAEYQLQNFNKLVKKIGKFGIQPEMCHTACSAALLLFEETKFEMVRPGISIYGLWPSRQTYLSYRLMGGSNNILSPVLSWKTKIAQIKTVPANQFVGYGCTYRTTARTRLAILPVGYYDGYDRGLSNLGYVLIKGKRAPVRGRVCMNLTMVDITHIKGVRLEEQVVLLGRYAEEEVTADQIADWLGTVNYEIVSRINDEIPRIIV